MRPRERRDSGQNDLFRARLDQIVDLDHALAKLGGAIDWRFLEDRFGAVYSDKAGHPPLLTRLMAGLSILKHMHDLSDEDLCARWVENPYYQLFCGEEFFQHNLTFDRSSLTRWRQRMGEEKLVALIQESLSVATRTGAAKPADFSKLIVDTTVQPKAVAFPTDAKLMDRARERLVKLARKTGVSLRQSYERVGKHALIAHQRYAHAKQFKRANRGAEDDPNLSRPGHSRHRAQDQWRGRTGERFRPSAHACPPRARAAPASARKEGLFSPRARGRVHWQRQGPSPLRVRRQGLARHHAQSLQGRPVHRPRQGAARQPLRRPHSRDRDPGDRDADRREPRPHRRRPRLSRPQRSARSQVQGLYLRPETPRHRDHQAPTPPPLGDRTGHRPRQGRAPYGPKLSRRRPWRRRQRRPRRRRIQLPPAPRLARCTLAGLHHGRPRQRPTRSHPSAKPPLKLIPNAAPNVAFFTGDRIALAGAAQAPAASDLRIFVERRSFDSSAILAREIAGDGGQSCRQNLC